MAFLLDDALVGWLVGKTGDALLGRLRVGPARAAMRTVVEDATAAAVTSVAEHLDSEQAEHLRCVLREREVDVDGEPVSVTSRSELEVALRSWTQALDQPEFNQPGYLTQMEIDPRLLAENLTSEIIAGIRQSARAGAPLNQLAEWLWRDDLDRKIDTMHQAVAGTRPAVQQTAPALPGGTPEFTGRQQQLDLLAERVLGHDPAGAVVAIHAVDGMAGVGKTELALRAAHDHKHRYPDGQYFINLHGYTDGTRLVDPAAALEQLLRQAGLPGQDIPADLAGRTARWQRLMSTRKALVLLDNASDAGQVEPLLPHAAGCLVLITSRSSMAELPGARTLALDLLPQAEAVELFCRIAAGRVRDRTVVATVVEAVGCLPVAVRAVAAQVGEGYTVAELASDLTEAKQRTSLTGVGAPLGTAVAAAFDVSVARLDPPHERAFWLLGMHPGPSIGVPQFAALADLTPPQAAGTLRTLARRNLLIPIDDQVGHRRWQLHDLLREHAHHHAGIHVDEQERLAALARLTTWYTNAIALVEIFVSASSARTAVPTVEGLALDGPQQAWAWLAAEQENLTAYAEQAVDQPAAEVCVRYAEQLDRLDRYAGATALYHSAACIHQLTGNQLGQARALTSLGGVSCEIGDYLAARGHYQAALDIARETGNMPGQAIALAELGRVARKLGDYPAARSHLEAGLNIANETGFPPMQAIALARLGEVARDIGDHAAARSHYQAALEIYQQTGDGEVQAYVLTSLGYVASDIGDHAAARSHYEAALDIYQLAGDRAKQAEALFGLGRVARDVGDLPSARNHLEEALDITTETGDRGWRAEALTSLGDVACDIGDTRAALSSYQAALDITRETGDRGGQAEALTRLGDVAWRAGDLPAARSHLGEALDIYRQTGYRSGQATALATLGLVTRLAGDRVSAHSHLEEALEIYQQIRGQSGRSGRAKALLWLGHVACDAGDYAAARSQLEAALGICQQTGELGARAVALTGLAGVACDAGDYAAARSHLKAALGIYQQTGDGDGQARMLTGLGDVAHEVGDYAGARSHFEAALKFYQKTGDGDGQAITLTGLGHVAKEERRHDEARARWQGALARVKVDNPLADSLRQELRQLDDG